MRALVAGDSRVLLRATTAALLARAHEVRLCSRWAADIAAEWPAGVEPRERAPGPPPWTAAARDCDLIVDLTAFDGADDDTRRVGVAPAGERDRGSATAPRLLVVLPRGADDGTRDLSRNDERFVLQAEHTYGYGPDLVTQFLVMMRSLPAVPVVPGNRLTFQPLWHEDLAAAIAASVELGSTGARQVTVAGPDAITQDDLYEQIAGLIGRRPLRVPVPEFVAAYAASLAAAFELMPETYAAEIERLRTVPPLRAADNALGPLGVSPTSFTAGLARLVRELDEHPPLEGVGTVQIKRFSVDIPGSHDDPPALLRRFRSRFADVMPVAVGVEPALPQTELAVGATLALALPGRGHVLIRVEDVSERHVLVATLRGHALAGGVRFAATSSERGTGFEITTFDAAGNRLDWAALTAGGARIQDANWRTVLENVATLAGGHAENVRQEVRNLNADEAAGVDAWIRDVIRRRRAENRESAAT